MSAYGGFPSPGAPVLAAKCVGRGGHGAGGFPSPGARGEMCWCCPRVSAKPLHPAEAERGRPRGGETKKKKRGSAFSAGEARRSRGRPSLSGRSSWWGGQAGVGVPVRVEDIML